jgi:hypothetical protein
VGLVKYHILGVRSKVIKHYVAFFQGCFRLVHMQDEFSEKSFVLGN